MYRKSRNTDVEPTRSEGGTHEDYKLEHEAFGQISIGRVQGGGVLYDSDFTHQHYITIKINESELSRSLSSDRHFAKKELIEVCMSESQFATMISSLNMGGGVPCTISHVQGVRRATIPPRDVHNLYRDEVAQDSAEAIAALEAAMTAIDEQGFPKGKAAIIKDLVNKALRKLNDSIPFVVQQFDEHIEETIESAKTEINGFLNETVTRKGLTAMSDTTLAIGTSLPIDN